MKPTVAILFISSLPLSAQGPLSPPGPPAPTQKSLQEIWDKISDLQGTVTAQQQQIALLQQQNSVLLESAGVPLSWKITTLAQNVELASRALAFSPAGFPAIAFYDSGPDDLMYASFNGGSWQITPVDVAGAVGGSASLAFSPAGSPSIAYYDGTNADLKYATYSSGTWNAVTVDSAGNVGNGCSLAFTATGQPAIAYNDDTDNDLKYAVFNGSVWQIQQVTPVTADNCRPSLAFNSSGKAGIAFQDGDQSAIKLALLESGGWFVDTVESRPVDGDQEYANPSLAFGPNGQAAIAYDHYGSTGILRVAIDEGGWTLDDAAQAGDWGFRPSLAFSPLGRPSVSYAYDPFGDPGPLGFARKSGPDDWDNSDVGPADNLAVISSLAFGPGGQAVIAYQAEDSNALKIAIRGPFGGR